MASFAYHVFIFMPPTATAQLIPIFLNIPAFSKVVSKVRRSTETLSYPDLINTGIEVIFAALLYLTHLHLR